MGSEELAKSVVSSLSHYLVRRAQVGNAAYNAELESLLGQVESVLSDPYSAEMFARFVANPADSVEAETLRLHLARQIDRDGDLARQLTGSLGGGMAGGGRLGGKRTKWVLAGAGTVVALVAGFIVTRGSSTEATGGSSPTTTTTTVSTTETALSTSTTTTTTSAPTSTTTSDTTTQPGSSDGAGIPGDGSVLSKGAPVFLTALPVPNNAWQFDHGDHDVQLTQYQNSLWTGFNSCYSNALSGEQRFRLKNFSRIEVKAVGTDSTSDPSLTVKFEIFVNNDDIHAIASVVANPGEAKPLAVDLPAGTFALMLRSSLTTVDKSKCKRGNAVWGAPYVVAAGR